MPFFEFEDRHWLQEIVGLLIESQALESQSPSKPDSQTCALLLAQCHSLTNLT